MTEPIDRVIKWEWRTDRSWPANPKKHLWFLVGPQYLGKRKAHRQIGIWTRQFPNQTEYHGPLTACGWRSGCDVPIDIVDPLKIEPCLRCWEVLTDRKWTDNQLVAYNLRRARQLRGWTQDEAAEQLEPHIGSRWSKATFSAAERSVDGNRIRQFTADNLVAFSKTFELSVTWFLQPPLTKDNNDD